ncbi:MAG: hypothetical protein LC658_03740 [Bacteroidales bacterium]|nr:hypothetical protein [Bacteroidales bacterium]
MFTRKKITIPADGETIIVNVGGCSIVVEEVGSYTTPEEVPSLQFESSDPPQPIYNQGIYSKNIDGFPRFAIIGTAESAGDILYLLISDEYLKPDLSPETFQSRRARAGVSFTVASTDVAQTLSQLNLADSNAFLPSKIYVSTRTNDISFAFNEDPEQDGGLGSIIPADKEPLPIEGIQFILGFRFISATNGVSGDLTVHLEY